MHAHKNYLLYKVSGIWTWYISSFDVQAADILMTEVAVAGMAKKGKATAFLAN